MNNFFGKVLEILIGILLPLTVIISLILTTIQLECSSPENSLTESDRFKNIRLQFASQTTQIIQIQDAAGEMNKKLDKLLEKFDETQVIYAEEVRMNHEIK